MCIRTLFLTVFLSICFSVTGQVDAFQKDIIDYLNVNGTYQQYNEAYDGMFEVLQNQFQTANVPENFWEELKSDKENSLVAVIKFLTFAYRKHFTKTDIVSMTTFYKTETGKQLVLDSSILTDDQREEVATFFESDLGVKISEKQKELSEDISDISSHWSRDLFAEKMSALVKAGYSIKR